MFTTNRYRLSSYIEHQIDKISFDYCLLRLERGTRIVCTAYADLKLVLQMPRGNLETIYPRPLLLTYICSELIDQEPRNYSRAFELMRKNRLNLNFLYDYKPKEFFEQISTFITRLRHDDDICLFLSVIEDEKDTRNEYMTYVLKTDRTLSSTNIDRQRWHPKANLICEQFRSCLQASSMPTDHVNSILTSYVKQSPTNMEGALTYLSQHPNHFDSAIRYLTYFIDIDRLYDIALGTYNFDLVLMISEKTQKDPKEYLPELNQLRAIVDRHWQKFKIDCRLKRFRKAIEHACDYFLEQLIDRTANEHDDHYVEFVNILESHRFYKLAIRRFLSNEHIQPTMLFIRDILRLYGNYLMTKKYYVEAGLIYERGQWTEQASQAFRQGKDVPNSLKFLPDMTKHVSLVTIEIRHRYYIELVRLKSRTKPSQWTMHV
jgi:elongator complex protein 1